MIELLAIDPGKFAYAMAVEFGHLLSLDWYRANWLAMINIILIDITLAGDNAIVVGMAASRVKPEMRAKVIFWGISAAVVLRILFAAVTTQILAIVGLTLAGGLLLAWVCWKMYRGIVDGHGPTMEEIEGTSSAPAIAGKELGFWGAVMQITAADVSMSLDNVLAVAGAAKGEPLVLVIGLGIAIVLMAVASAFIAKLLVRYPWISWLGLLVIVWVALDMIYRGSHEVTCQAFNFGCSETLWQGVKHRLGL
ncbi:MAG: TerC family protein [Pseudomonadota bacterium]